MTNNHGHEDGQAPQHHVKEVSLLGTIFPNRYAGVGISAVVVTILLLFLYGVASG